MILKFYYKTYHFHLSSYPSFIYGLSLFLLFKAPSAITVAAQPRQAGSQPPIQHRAGSRTLTPERLAKLRSQLDVVQGNIQVMSEMLIAITPGEESSEDRDLLTVSFTWFSL